MRRRRAGRAHLQAYIARRIVLLPAMLVGITLLAFVLSHAIPADPLAANLGELAAADPVVVAAFRQQWGLDRGLHEQYLIYLWNLLQGNMGTSISTRQPVALELRRRVPATIELAVPALAVSVGLGVPLGILAAVRRNTLVDQCARVLAIVGASTPLFWLGLIAIFVLYYRLGIVPAPGRLSATIPSPPFRTGFLLIDALAVGRLDAVADWARHLVLPASVLSVYSLARVTRLMRGSMLEVLGEDYVRTARAKGLRQSVVVLRHAARNALIPVITVIGLSFGDLLAGAVITETVFSWPGMGLYAFSSATSLDFPAILGAGIVVAAIYVLVNLLVDVAYAVVDPRIRVR
ncbi:MAG: ABC transporter permease [Armatimonadetes bacterium]|nr:ABC transporter permease [Armatimonadota bacterium]